MTPLTTPEVLRLLEGGNESALAKRDIRLALIFMGRLVKEAKIEWRFHIEWIPIGPQNLEQNILTLGDVRGTIPSEVVTKYLGPYYNGTYNKRMPRPAIVISTEGVS